MGCAWVNVGVLTILILLIVTNIVSRAFFRKPVLGTVEMAELLTLVTVFLSLAYTELRHGHVSVSLLTSKFPRMLKMAIAFIMSIFAALYFLSMSWESASEMLAYLSPLRASSTLNIPYFPFMGLIAFCSLALGLLILVNMFPAAPGPMARKLEERGDL